MRYMEDQADGGGNRAGRDFGKRGPGLDRRTVLTLGNFDGIHLGHRQLLEQSVRIAKERALRAVFFTFSPHSSALIPSKPTPRLLYSLPQKIFLLEEFGGIDIFLNFRFDTALGEMPAARFFYEILLRRYRAAAIVVGEGFRFGREGEGDTELLARYCQREGLLFVQSPCLYWQGEPVSSTRIRRLVERGNMREANELLGRPYFLAGTVERGRRLGSKRLVPTANLAMPPELLAPPDGVYISRTYLAGASCASVTNVGKNPTVGGKEALRAETHILDYAEDVYGRPVRVELLRYLRPEIRFASLDDLKKQIMRDIEKTRLYFGPEQGGNHHDAIQGTQ